MAPTVATVSTAARVRADHRSQYYYNWPKTWEMIRAMQPDACVFSDVGPDIRWVGNERGIAGAPVGLRSIPSVRRADPPRRQRKYARFAIGQSQRQAVDPGRVRCLDSSRLVLARAEMRA